MGKMDLLKESKSNLETEEESKLETRGNFKLETQKGIRIQKNEFHKCGVSRQNANYENGQHFVLLET